jgi:predicted transcriptional regulator
MMKMNKKTMEGLLNPVRMRIVMMFLDNSQHTIGEIKKSVKDIPSASLYRHINRLLEDDIIHVVSEVKKRGATERTYQLKMNPFDEMNKLATDGSKEDMKEMFYTFSMSNVVEFNEYIEHDNIDLVKDSVGYRSFPLYVTPEENEEFLEGFKSLISKYINNEASEGRILRKFSFIYTPTNSGGRKQ